MQYIYGWRTIGLRLHPALLYMERVATEDNVLPLATPLIKPNGEEWLTYIQVPDRCISIFTATFETIANAICIDNDYSYHRQLPLASVWEDATFWKPERWLDPSTLPDQSDIPKGWGNLRLVMGPETALGADWDSLLIYWELMCYRLCPSYLIGII
jgi:hypothetical protein